MADEIVFDGSDFESLGRDLRGAANRVREETQPMLREIGLELEAEAKVLASQHSKTIAGTIKMRELPGSVVISAGSADVPIAALYEKGNKGSKVTDTTFRHPVFGSSDAWVKQARYPFLRPALAANRREITKRLESTWDKALEPYRLKPRDV